MRKILTVIFFASLFIGCRNYGDVNPRFESLTFRYENKTDENIVLKCYLSEYYNGAHKDSVLVIPHSGALEIGSSGDPLFDSDSVEIIKGDRKLMFRALSKTSFYNLSNYQQKKTDKNWAYVYTFKYHDFD